MAYPLNKELSRQRECRSEGGGGDRGHNYVSMFYMLAFFAAGIIEFSSAYVTQLIIN